MLHVTVDKIKNGTVGASFNVTFSVPIEELTELLMLHEYFKNMNMCNFKFKPKEEAKENKNV